MANPYKEVGLEIRYENFKYLTIKEVIKKLQEINLFISSYDFNQLNKKDQDKIKSDLKKLLDELYLDVYNSAKKEIEEINQTLAPKEEKSNPFLVLSALFLGFTFKQMLERQKNAQILSINKDISFLGKVRRDTILSASKRIRDIIKTYSKAEREKVRDKFETSDTGWISLAVLDSKTSAICLSLHNKVYKVKNRSDVPNKPPRHFGCRTILEPYDGKKDITIEEYFKENDDEARALLGERKYKLFADGRLKIKGFLDVANGKMFTIKEIEQFIEDNQ